MKKSQTMENQRDQKEVNANNKNKDKVNMKTGEK